PRMASRRFVLQPLADLAPDLEVGGQTVRMALDACPAVPEVVPVATPS
ncbi:MAG TPA: 2-amino-4-hydroxy-6-hydroxymethyldihydropteridine diphosphokinase, partial [Flavobacteriales bacterium]|nr:2-amino-4-hydroxy-6-hydroxymethyldihydropteridine diphosphokinase [Flavobacteriales bacterium]